MESLNGSHNDRGLLQEPYCDYFHRMGGAGRYVGYEDWHPAVLTLGCAYQAMKVRTFSELQPFWSRLPYPS